MNGIITQQGHKPFAINGMPDHVHVLVSMNPVQAPSDMMFHVKRSSSLWINQNKYVPGKFSWQEGFGAFYEEYLDLLKEYDIEFDEKYIFKPI